MHGEHNYCAQAVRDGDHGRYLTALYAPARARPWLLALYAFNLELAHVRAAVSEPLLGEIRLTWWRETVDGVYAGMPRAHPVAQALAAAVAATSPPRTLFDAMIDGRMLELDGAALAQDQALLDHADMTGGATQALAAWLALGNDPGTQASAAARAVGRAWALVGLVRAIGFQARLGGASVPDSFWHGQNIDPARLYRGAIAPEIQAIAKRLADQAGSALTAARQACPRPDPALLPALLPAVLAADYLRRFARWDYDVRHPGLEAGALTRQLKLMWAASRRRI
ncbi:MAG: squalene/phytoene synthase family protein [Sphingomonadales bacterium]